MNFSEFVSTLVKFDLIYFVSEKCFSTFLKIFLFSFLFSAQLLFLVSSSCSFFKNKRAEKERRLDATDVPRTRSVTSERI